MRALVSAVLAGAALVGLSTPTYAASVSFAIDLTLSQDGLPVDPEPGLNGSFPAAGMFSVDEALLFGPGQGFVRFDQLDDFSLTLDSFSVNQAQIEAGACSPDSPNCGLVFSGARPLGVVGFFRTPTSSERFLEFANLGADPFDPAAGFQFASVVVPLASTVFDPIASGPVAFRQLTAPMPEPSSMAAFGLGAGLLGLASWRRSRRTRRTERRADS
jgi:hypothetical protein